MLQIPRKISHDVLEIPENPKDFLKMSMKTHVWARAHRPPSVVAKYAARRRRDTAKLPN